MQQTVDSGEAADVILATNMISVGVDVDRLGLMVVMGQPQSTSEYIQSTSRVGRRYPGFVVVLFNAAKSRDRSHYESFIAYHQALYRQVEPTSVTPFSVRARDRAIHAVLVALARLTLPEFRPNEGASAAAQHRGKLEEIRDLIVERVRQVDDREAGEAYDQLNELIEAWANRAAHDPDLVYSNSRDPDHSLLVDAGLSTPEDDGSLPTLNSMRDVDQESRLYVVG
jgi:hypothetical protein